MNSIDLTVTSKLIRALSEPTARGAGQRIRSIDAVNISDTKLDVPAALPTFVFASATRTSSSVIRSAGPLVGLASSKRSLFHSNSLFSSFSNYPFHTCFILELSPFNGENPLLGILTIYFGLVFAGTCPINL